ncbi:hypothetical protein FRC05_001623 [Tulasnella sp. 425]|nr:hypothetical protein FRC05_001623 [Tulasnella sp. 425]
MVKQKGVRHIVLPQADAEVFEGVIQIYDRVEKLAWESSDSYFVLARKYVGLVLDQVIMSYVMGEQQQFMGFTASLETLWRSSNYGMDVMHLSRGANYIKGAATSSNEFEFTEQPNKLTLDPLQLLPPLPAEFNDLEDALRLHIRHTSPSVTPIACNQGEMEMEETMIEREPHQIRSNESDFQGPIAPGEEYTHKRVQALHISEDETDRPASQEPVLGAILGSMREVAIAHMEWKACRTVENARFVVWTIRAHLVQCTFERMEVFDREWVEEMLTILRQIWETQAREEETTNEDQDVRYIAKYAPQLIDVLSRILTN